MWIRPHRWLWLYATVNLSYIVGGDLTSSLLDVLYSPLQDAKTQVISETIYWWPFLDRKYLKKHFSGCFHLLPNISKKTLAMPSAGGLTRFHRVYHRQPDSARDPTERLHVCTVQYCS